MADLKLQSNPSGTGSFTVQPPNSNNTRTITLPDGTTTLVGTDTAQTLSGKTITQSVINGGALNYATIQASTSGSNIDFLNIPSWVNRITVMFVGVSTNGVSGIAIQLGDAGGIETTGYDGGTASIIGTNATSAAANSSGFSLLPASVAASTYSGDVTITRFAPGSNVWICRGQIAAQNGLMYFAAGSKTLSENLNQLRVTVGANAFDLGNINIVYEG